MANRNLSIGRGVHYVMPSNHHLAGQHKPAVVLTAYNPTAANLMIFTEDGTLNAVNVVLDDSPEPRPGTWHWPEIV
jgi:hypothetical protein